MGIALGDLLQIVDVQSYLGEQILNVYYYRWFSAPVLDNTAYEPLIDDFKNEVIMYVRPVQNTALIHERVILKNLSNGIDFAEVEIDVAGAIATPIGERLPSYMALGYQLVRDSLVTRSGSKRFAGLSDSQVQENSYAGNTEDAEAVEEALSRNLTVGLIEVAAPIIPKRPIPVPAGSAYVYSSIVDSIFKGVTTQNTRKAGRGA